MASTTAPLQQCQDNSTIFPVPTSGLKFQNSTASYSQSALNYYESASIGSLTASGFSAGSWVPTVSVTRLGNIVYIQFVGAASATASAGKITFAASSIPARFCPSGTRTCAFPVLPTSGGANPEIVIATNGAMTIQGAGGTDFGAGAWAAESGLVAYYLI